MYVYEVWNFKQRSKELFSPYIKTFMKLKKASGWPSECDTEEKRKTYLDDYKAHEGIELDPAKVEKNPGLRSLIKLMLNSFWGKFGQRPNQTQVTTCVKPSEFFNIIKDRQVVHRIEIANEEMVEVYHTVENECKPVQTNVNIFIACFTTSYARLKLYDALDTLKERVLYFDTDSVIYTKKPAESSIPTGNYLGEFTNELDEGDHITEFGAAGPKNYAYKKNLVLDEILNEEEEQQPRTLTLHNPHKITRCAATKTIKTVSQNKMHKLVFDKRVIDHDTFQSFPYGYKSSFTTHL